MRLLKVIAVSGCLLLAACGGNKAATAPPVGYVEVPNPAVTMYPNAPDTIWVPRSYVEKGVPCGGELVNKGIDQLFSKNPQPKPQQSVAVPQIPAPAPAPGAPSQAMIKPAYPQPVPSPVAAPAVPNTLKHRLVIIEIGKNGLLQPLQEQLRRTGTAVFADPAQAEFLARSAALSGPEGKGSFAASLQQGYNVNEVIFVSAPAGLGAGKSITAEVYDTLGGGLLRGIDAAIPSYAEADQSAKAAAVAAALGEVTAKVNELIPLIPWYSRISAVNGNRAYITAGKETGLRVGQTLKVYRGGKFMKGLGFAPGSRIGVIEVDGFVGLNAAFCAIKDGQGIEASDVVSAD